MNPGADVRTVHSVSREEVMVNEKKIFQVSSEPQDRTELDSHADTCVAGANCVLESDSMQRVRVSGFSKELKPIDDVPIGTCLTAYDMPGGETILLVIHEAIYFGSRMKHTLLCPNQMRDNGIQVEDTPCQFDSQSRHAIIIPKTDADPELTLPLELRGIISFIPTRLPTEREIEHCSRVELTSSSPWEPYSERFKAEEKSILRKTNTVCHKNVSFTEVQQDKTDLAIKIPQVRDKPVRRVLSEVSAERLCATVTRYDQFINSCNDFFDENFMNQDPEAWPEADKENGDSNQPAPEPPDHESNPREVDSISSSLKKSKLTKEALARRWGIGLLAAERTLKVTTQKGIRTVLNPVEKRYRTRQTHLRFPSLNAKIYSDTMFATTKSVRNHKMAQVFTDSKGYTKFYPMDQKSEAGTQLWRFVNQVGIPKTLVTDNAREETQGSWLKCVKDCHIMTRTTEPYSPWQNKAEAEIRELKKMMMRHQRKTGSPKRLWCYLGEWVSHIRSLTASDHPGLNGRTPAEIMISSTPDISEYAIFDWYEPVWVWDGTGRLPDDKRKLMRFIGVADTAGAAMTMNVIAESGHVFTRSTVSSLSEDDKKSPVVKRLLEELDKGIEKVIGDKVEGDLDKETVKNLFPESEYVKPNGEVMTNPYIYDDDISTSSLFKISESKLDEEEDSEEPTPIHQDEYLTMQVLLPYGGIPRRRRLKEGKRMMMASLSVDGTTIQFWIQGNMKSSFQTGQPIL